MDHLDQHIKLFLLMFQVLPTCNDNMNTYQNLILCIMYIYEFIKIYVIEIDKFYKLQTRRQSGSYL